MDRAGSPSQDPERYSACKTHKDDLTCPFLSDSRSYEFALCTKCGAQSQGGGWLGDMYLQNRESILRYFPVCEPAVKEYETNNQRNEMVIRGELDIVQNKLAEMNACKLQLEFHESRLQAIKMDLQDELEAHHDEVEDEMVTTVSVPSPPAATKITDTLATPNDIYHDEFEDQSETCNSTTNDSSSSDMSVLVDNDENEGDELSAVSAGTSDYPKALITPTPDKLKCSCWKCHKALELPKPQFSCYAMHSHPLLEVPVCSVCCAQVEEAEIGRFDDSFFKPTQDKHTINSRSSETVVDLYDSDESESIVANDSQPKYPVFCSLCAIHGDDLEDGIVLFLCNVKSCNRGVCTKCESQAQGGGKKGAKDVWEEQHSNDKNSEWHCPLCKPRPSMRQLVKVVRKKRIRTRTTAGAHS